MLYFFAVLYKNEFNAEKYKVPLKLHRQFSHLHNGRLLRLLQDRKKDGEELKSHIKDLYVK